MHACRSTLEDPTYICVGQHFLYRGYRWLQPIPLLARLAAETNPDVKLVITVLITPIYHPVMLAEELATLDVVSDGRLVVGAGTGYAHAEFDHFGVPYEERYKRLEESIALMKLLWSEDVVNFDGQFWKLHDAPVHIKPIQQPRPPLWFGAMKPPAIRRAARLGDAWIIVPGASFAEIESGLAVFDAEREQHGLPPSRIPLRREIVIGENQDDAVEIFRERSQERYLAYAAREHPELSADRLRQGFAEWALDRAVLGTGEECVAQLRRLPLDRLGPITVRPAWPGQSIEDVEAYLAQMGREVISAFR